MKKLITAVLGGTAVASLAFASASTLNVDGGVVQVGEDITLTCDDDGVKVDFGLETDTDLVHRATVTGIAEDCLGADIVLQTNLLANNEKLVGEIAGDTHVFTFATPQDAAALESVKVWIGR